MEKCMKTIWIKRILRWTLFFPITFFILLFLFGMWCFMEKDIGPYIMEDIKNLC